AKNQFSTGKTYDAAGNMTFDGVYYYVYDAENRLTQVQSDNTVRDCSTTIACYFYNADGQRIAKYTQGGAVTTFYVYGTDGEVVANPDANLNGNQPYTRSGARHVAQSRANPTSFTPLDPLGSTRLITLYNGGSPYKRS